MKNWICITIVLASTALLSSRYTVDLAQNKSAPESELRAALKDPSHKLWSEAAPNTFRVRLETSKGSFVIEAMRDWAPRGVDRFYNLTRTGFFDDSRLFRIRANYIAQFGVAGDPVI